MTSRSGFCARRSIRNGTHFYITAEHKSQSSPLLFMRTCCSLTGALHAPTTLNECGVPIFRALRSTLPPEHTLRRACHCVHVVSNYNVAMIVRCIGQHTDINLNSMKGLQMSPCAWLVKNDKKQSAGPGPHAASSIASGFTRSFSKQLTHSASARMIRRCAHNSIRSRSRSMSTGGASCTSPAEEDDRAVVGEPTTSDERAGAASRLDADGVSSALERMATIASKSSLLNFLALAFRRAFWRRAFFRFFINVFRSDFIFAASERKRSSTCAGVSVPGFSRIDARPDAASGQSPSPVPEAPRSDASVVPAAAGSVSSTMGMADD